MQRALNRARVGTTVLRRNARVSLQHLCSAPVAALSSIWVSWFATVLLLGLLWPQTGAPEWAAYIAVLLHSFVAIVILARHPDGRVATVLGLSLILRTTLVFWDLNFSHIFSLPNSGADSEMFFHYAVVVAEDPSVIFEDSRAGMFSKLFGLLFWVTGVQRAIGQYTNVLLGLSVVLLVEAIMRHLPIENVRYLQILTVVALLPNSVIMSAIFLRESIIAFLIAVSAYFFVRWFSGGSTLNMLAVLTAVLAASTFHAGVVAVGAGYMVVAVLYRRGARRFGFGWHSLPYLAIAVVVIQLVVARYPDVFLGQFEDFNNEEDLLTSTNRRMGGSQYLTNLTVNSYADMLRVGPLRALYFLGSPMPWDARGVVDIFIFLTDSLFYLGVPLLLLMVRKRLSRNERMLGYALLIAIFLASLVFGAGVSNAGTAVRHRFKLISLFMALLAITATAVRRRAPTRLDGSEGGRPGARRSFTRGLSDD